MTFDEFNLNKDLLKAISDLGFETPSEIQEKAIPILISGDTDFVGQAQTGTGKTAAFVLPLLQNLNPKSGKIQSLILLPTRELAKQVHEQIEKLAKYTGLKAECIFGGASYDKQIGNIRKRRPQVIVGTPGRVIDLMKKKVLDFSSAEYLILDEADEMLNMGFLDAVHEIIESFNENKKTWMFSATMPQAITRLVEKEFNEPQMVFLKKKTLSNESVEQRYYVVKRKYRREALARILESEKDFYGIIFCRTRVDTKELSDELIAKGFSAEILNGDMGQALRESAMRKFKNRKVNILVCTDVAARGIDVKDLTHVVNYGIPQDNESFVHRIGRTGRAGAKGIAITLVDPRDVYFIKRLESFTKSKMTLFELPTPESLKELLVSKEMESMQGVIEAVRGKGETFTTDQTFDSFEKSFEGLTSQEILKIMFTWNFNKKMRRYDDIGSIDVRGYESEGRSDRNSRRDSRDSRPNDRTKRKSRRSRTSAGNTRLFMNMGKDDGLHLTSLLQEISAQTGLEKRDIQNVDLKGKFSFLEVPTNYSDALLKGRDFKVDKRNVRFEISN